MNMMDFIGRRLSEAKRINAAATPGPWAPDNYDGGVRDEFSVWYQEEDGRPNMVCNEMDRPDVAFVSENNPWRNARMLKVVEYALEMAFVRGNKDVKFGDDLATHEPLLRALYPVAIVWEDHPDFDQSWHQFKEQA